MKVMIIFINWQKKEKIKIIVYDRTDSDIIFRIIIAHQYYFKYIIYIILFGKVKFTIKSNFDNL